MTICMFTCLACKRSLVTRLARPEKADFGDFAVVVGDVTGDDAVSMLGEEAVACGGGDINRSFRVFCCFDAAKKSPSLSFPKMETTITTTEKQAKLLQREEP